MPRKPTVGELGEPALRQVRRFLPLGQLLQTPTSPTEPAHYASLPLRRPVFPPETVRPTLPSATVVWFDLRRIRHFTLLSQDLRINREPCCNQSQMDRLVRIGSNQQVRNLL